jgi:hypothetical protein
MRWVVWSLGRVVWCGGQALALALTLAAAD